MLGRSFLSSIILLSSPSEGSQWLHGISGGYLGSAPPPTPPVTPVSTSMANRLRQKVGDMAHNTANLAKAPFIGAKNVVTTHPKKTMASLVTLAGATGAGIAVKKFLDNRNKNQDSVVIDGTEDLQANPQQKTAVDKPAQEADVQEKPEPEMVIPPNSVQKDKNVQKKEGGNGPMVAVGITLVVLVGVIGAYMLMSPSDDDDKDLDSTDED